MNWVWIVAVAVFFVAVTASIVYALLAMRRFSKRVTPPVIPAGAGISKPEIPAQGRNDSELALYRQRKAAKFNRQLAKRKRIVQRWKEM